jgi:quinone-modifying oxidoreductase subunit QmoC
MAIHPKVIPSADFRKALKERGGETASKCYQCATCSSVCELAPDDSPFPRRQMLWAQWGLADHMAADPGVWLCHQCNDCTTRCPRDAKPGDVMQVARSLAVEKLAVPGFMGKLVGKASLTWPLLLGLPLAFWIVVLYLLHGFTIPGQPLIYHDFVPHWLIYIVYIPVFGLAGLFALASGLRFWKMLGNTQKRSGAFIADVSPALFDVAGHRRFGNCGTVALYILDEYPLPFWHPFKIVGNVAAIFLMVGGFWLLINRLRVNTPAGSSSAYDNFFMSLVLTVIVTGVLTEAARFWFSPDLACWIYILHLASILCLFATFPYCKFAHLLYRTLAMVHERMAVKSKSV